MNPETENYLSRLEDLRDIIRGYVVDLPADALNWRPIQPGEGEDDHVTNSLAVMAVHVAGAESFWIQEVIGGQPPSRDRDAEFVTQVESVEPILARLDAVGAETRRIMQGLTAADLERTYYVRERAVTGRWAILHAIEHAALHLGHMQMTRQLWNNGQPLHSPRWFQRVKNSDE
jgi:uncharacterized damage-inducible protein DinB